MAPHTLIWLSGLMLCSVQCVFLFCTGHSAEGHQQDPVFGMQARVPAVCPSTSKAHAASPTASDVLSCLLMILGIYRAITVPINNTISAERQFGQLVCTNLHQKHKVTV